MSKFYAGIGSRETPEDFLRLFRSAAKHLAQNNYTLRSGGADGADMAFETGCKQVNGPMEIYIPWPGFNNNSSPLSNIPDWAYKLAAQTHPAWERCSQGGRKLHARNCMQMFGQDGNTPVEFVICWTPQGSGSGGTGQALRLAQRHNITVFDAGHYRTMEAAYADLREFIKRKI